MGGYPTTASQRTEPVQKVLVLLPGWNGGDQRGFADFLKGVSFHLEICPRVDLSGFDIHMAQEVPDHVQRDSTLQQVHAFRVSKRVWTHRSVQTGTRVSCFHEIFLKDVTDSGWRQPLVESIPEKRLVELFGTIEVVFAYVVAQKLDRVLHQGHSAHLASFAQKA